MNVNINVNFNIYPAAPSLHSFPPSVGHQAPDNPTPPVIGEYPSYPGQHGQYAGGHFPPYPPFYPPHTPFHPTPYSHTGEGSVKYKQYFNTWLMSTPHYARRVFDPLQSPYDRAKRRRRRTGDAAPISILDDKNNNNKHI